ncbi:hypothetical protein CN265_20955 [Priestia megaterium]|jgi:hypothetical protein|nr:hypothetical protein CON11_01100 [Priestia megaterium]PFB05734.1 hypothetical protein CN383_05375 [Priestia megaterium]PFD97462.1 hypothetical protein CN265_20955 [Priestia megaterium]TCN12243.1 hypothetical protein EV581_103616 [Bacillus sp. BK006]CAH0164516.1 hypothetical protein SRABI82_01028 [Priestia megaterium]
MRDMSISLFSNGEIVNIKASNERVIILKSHYVKNMKRYSYTVDKYPSTFFFEEELMKHE